jgi:PAS domain S-box-containing protein
MKWEQTKNGDGLMESIIILNQHGIIRWASSSIHALIGYLPDEIIGKDIFSLVCKDSSKKIKKLYEEIYKNPSLINEGLKQFIGKNGEKIPLSVTLNDISGFPEMSGMMVHMRHFDQEKNATNIPFLLDEVEIEIELRKKIEREIAAELHDNVSSGLAAVKLILEYSLRDTNKYSAEVRELPVILAELIKDVRNLSHSLTKRAVRDFELHETLNLLIEKIRKISVLRIVLKYDKPVERVLKNNQKIHLARIIQEQVMNIINHANATKALISVQYKNEKVIAVTRDNGKGFDPENYHGGIGLSNMYYRVNVLGGNMHINSKCGKGTTIAMVFPSNL